MKYQLLMDGRVVDEREKISTLDEAFECYRALASLPKPYHMARQDFILCGDREIRARDPGDNIDIIIRLI